MTYSKNGVHEAVIIPPTGLMWLLEWKVLEDIEAAIGATILEVVRPPKLTGWPRHVMAGYPVFIVDDDGMAKRLPGNDRASRLYAPGQAQFVYGPVAVVGEALVSDLDGKVEPDIVGLEQVWSTHDDLIGRVAEVLAQ